MEIIWSALAMRRRNEIFDFIALDNPDAAQELNKKFDITALHILAFPLLGRATEIENTREWLVGKHYVIIYEIGKNKINILTIMHTSQKRQSRFK